jgi:hypothetical protein
MKHAGPQTLAALDPMLRALRAQASLVERTPGSFYRKSKAFLHFHEDPAGIFADVKIDGDKFTRLQVSTADQQATLLQLVGQALR